MKQYILNSNTREPCSRTILEKKNASSNSLLNSNQLFNQDPPRSRLKMDRFKRKNNLSIVPSSSVIEKIESEEIMTRGRGRPCKMSPSENIYIHDVRPISDSVATCRSQPMKNDHVTTMEPPRGESSLSRERKTRQLVRCE